MKKLLYITFAVLVVGIIIFLQTMESTDSVQEKTMISEMAEAEEEKGLKFPYELEEGKLEVSALFQSDIPNPDRNFEEAVNLASMELINKSDQYLEKADVKVILLDGTELLFQIWDVPVGKTVWAFELNNTEIEENFVCKEIHCEAKFDEAYKGWEHAYEAVSETAIVKITNLTDVEKQNLDVNLHCELEGVYFGGISYNYTIDRVLPQESTEIEVLECYFGNAEVVKIGE